jgi:hypothetical protein
MKLQTSLMLIFTFELFVEISSLIQAILFVFWALYFEEIQVMF